jgi:hypothetical protein
MRYRAGPLNILRVLRSTQASRATSACLPERTLLSQATIGHMGLTRMNSIDLKRQNVDRFRHDDSDHVVGGHRVVQRCDVPHDPACSRRRALSDVHAPREFLSVDVPATPSTDTPTGM